MTTQDVIDNVSVGWNYLWRITQEQYAAQVAANPTVYQADVTRFVQSLDASRRALDRLRVAISQTGNTPSDVAHYNRLARQHYELSSRFYADTRPTQQTSLGFIAVLIVLGLAVGATAAAWAVGTLAHALNLHEQTSLASRELDARVAASKEGRQLQLSTLPPPPTEPPPSTKGVSRWMVGGALAAAGLLWLQHRFKTE